MGAFTKSVLILLIAVTTPALYRHFASESTVKSLSSYYSNYRSIDLFLRHSANQIDSVKDYLNIPDQFKGAANKFNGLINKLVVSLEKKGENVSDQSKVVKAKEGVTNKGAQQLKYSTCEGDEAVRLWNKEELAEYNGASPKSEVYLGYLGIVYNVTMNRKHYAVGADYNVFAGCDATRAFITGNFTHDLHDNLEGIDSSSFSQIDTWEAFYRNSYSNLGKIKGYFYDGTGCATKDYKALRQKIEQKLKEETAETKNLERELFDCNTEWNTDQKSGRVWCTTKSGGYERSWAGVPRLYRNGETSRCTCFNVDGPEADDLSKHMSLYPGCDPKASECKLTE